MKYINKEIKIVTLCVILTLIFLCSFNVVYSYFTAAKGIEANIQFANLNVYMQYREEHGGEYISISNKKQFYPTMPLNRDMATSLKSDPESTNEIDTIVVRSDSGAVSAYVRFYLEVYKVHQTTTGEVLYIDSKGNFVNESGTYVNSEGEEVDDSTLTKGVIVDYAEYFNIGSLSEETFTASPKLIRQENEVNGQNYVTYFLNSALGVGVRVLDINSIKMLASAPEELLDSSVIIFMSMESVQASNKAYLTVFDDKYGYYNWES